MPVRRDYFISEANFSESMKNIVEPFLKARAEGVNSLANFWRSPLSRSVSAV